jgi:hypothetical protein
MKCGGEMKITAHCRKFQIYDDRSFELYRVFGDSMDQVLHLLFCNGNQYESIAHIIDEVKFSNCMLKSPPWEFEERLTMSPLYIDRLQNSSGKKEMLRKRQLKPS